MFLSKILPRTQATSLYPQINQDVGILTICVTLWYVNSVHNIIENVPQKRTSNVIKKHR